MAGWNIQEPVKKLLETLENPDEYEIVFPLVMTPDTAKLVSRVRRNFESSEVQTQYAMQLAAYGNDTSSFEGGNNADVPADNESKEDTTRKVKSVTRSKTDGNKARMSSNNNHNTHTTLENINIEKGWDEMANRRVENVPNHQRKTTHFDHKIKKHSTDTGANTNKPDVTTLISLKDWILEVKVNPSLLIQEGLEAEWVTEGQRQSVETGGGCKLQTGFVRGDLNSTVALTMCDTSPIEASGTGDMTGFIQVNGDSYFIQPIVLSGQLNRQHPHLVYKTKISLDLGDDQDFADKWTQSESDSSQVNAIGSTNDSGAAGKVVPDCLRRSKRESYWRSNMTEIKLSNMTGKENASSSEETPEVRLVEQPEENLEHTRAIIEDARKKLEREEVGYLLGSDMEIEGKTDGVLTEVCSERLFLRHSLLPRNPGF